MSAPDVLRILVWLALAGCSKPVDVSFRLASDGALVVTRTAKSVTRTPFGPEGLEIKSTKRLDVLEGGRGGVDRLHWMETWTRYEIKVEAPGGEFNWTMAPDERGIVKPLAPEYAALGPHPPREVWVEPDRSVLVLWLPWPEPEPPPDARARPRPVEVPAPEEDPLAEPEPPPEPVQVSLEEVDNYFAGLVLAPIEPVKPGYSWSWKVSEQVTRGGDVSTTSTWTFEQLVGPEAVLVETLSLADAMAPAEGEFRTSALSGSGEMRLDLETGMPTSYTSSYEADLASPSARGTSSMKVETKFRWKGGGE